LFKSLHQPILIFLFSHPRTFDYDECSSQQLWGTITKSGVLGRVTQIGPLIRCTSILCGPRLRPDGHTTARATTTCGLWAPFASSNQYHRQCRPRVTIERFQPNLQHPLASQLMYAAAWATDSDGSVTQGQFYRRKSWIGQRSPNGHTLGPDLPEPPSGGAIQ